MVLTKEGFGFLNGCEFLNSLNVDLLDLLNKHGERKKVAAATPIYLPSERADSIYLIGSGLVKICHLTIDGKSSTLAYYKAGELFGESALFGEKFRGEYVESVEASMLIRIPMTCVQELLNRDSRIANSVTKLVSQRRQRVERRLRTLLFTSNQDRLNHLLLDLSEQFGEPNDEGVKLGLKLSHQEIANLIGTTRETVTILMGKLKTDGLICGHRQTVVLCDVERLAQSVGRRAP